MKAVFEKVIPHQDESFQCVRLDLPRFVARWHFHPECELILILNGRGERFVGDHAGTYGPGDLALVGSRLPHWYRSEPKPGGRQRSSAVIAQFQPDFLGAGFMVKPELRGVRDLLVRAGQGIQFTGRARTRGAARLKGLLRFEGLPRLTEFLSILDALSASGEYRQLASAGFLGALTDTHSERINAACNYVLKNYPREVRLADAAEQAHLSPSAFSRFFHKMTSRTFALYVNEVRVGEACRQLFETDKTVAEICFACGFGTLSNFNRRFRQLKRITPTEMRARFHPPSA